MKSCEAKVVKYVALTVAAGAFVRLPWHASRLVLPEPIRGSNFATGDAVVCADASLAKGVMAMDGSAHQIDCRRIRP